MSKKRFRFGKSHRMRKEILELVSIGMDAVDHDSTAGGHERLQELLEIIGDGAPLNLNEAAALISAFPEDDPADYASILFDSISDATVEVRTYIIRAAKRGELLADIKQNCAMDDDIIIDMDCGVRFTREIWPSGDVESWMMSIPAVELTPQDFRMLLTFGVEDISQPWSDKFSEKARRHVVDLLAVNCTSREKEWFTDEEMQAIDSWTDSVGNPTFFS